MSLPGRIARSDHRVTSRATHPFACAFLRAAAVSREFPERENPEYRPPEREPEGEA
jgi:hypothetical protein